jgi:predicted Fe-Mo cluster-binding NifX family protein
MKIVVTATYPNLDSAIDSRFGRADYFVVVDVDTLEWRASPNPGVNASGGAGTLAAQYVSDQGAQAVVSGDFGPNAYSVLNTAGVDMYLIGHAQTVREAVEHFKDGKLTLIGKPTSAQHRHDH